MEGLSALPEPGTAGIGSLDALIAYLRESGLSLGEGAGSVLAGIGALLDPRYGWSGREVADRPGRELLQGILQAPMVVGAPLMPALPMLSGARAGGIRYNFSHGNSSKDAAPQAPSAPSKTSISSTQPPDRRRLVDAEPGRRPAPADDVPDVRERGAGGGLPSGLSDPEGRPLSARYIVGKRTPDGPDVPLSLEEAQGMIRSLANGLEYVPARQLPRAEGVTRSRGEPATWQEVWIRQNEAENPSVHRHEGGHVIDNLALARNALSKGRPITRNAITSSAETRPMAWIRKMPGLKDPTELTADAMQAYMANPARFKAKYPDLARWIRDSVNEHPVVSGAIQFNQIAPFAIGGAGLGAIGLPGDIEP